MKLFDVGKVGCYCEAITHSTERRKDGEHKVIQLSLKVEPFDVKLATALSPVVRATLFKLGNAEPHEHLRRVSFGLGVPRQRMEVFATPDIPTGKLLIDDVRIGEIYARTSNNARTYSLVFKAIWGPASAKELEAAEAWRNTMAFVTFTEAAYNEALDLDAGADEEHEDDDKQQALPDPEFETDGAGQPLTADTDRAASREREHARHAKPRHADRRSAAKAKQKGRKRR
jgi:hypothetical protein